MGVRGVVFFTFFIVLYAAGEERKLGLEFSLDDIKKPKAGDNPPSLYLRTDVGLERSFFF